MLLDIRRETIERLFSEENHRRTRIVVGPMYSLYNGLAGLIGNLYLVLRLIIKQLNNSKINDEPS